MSSRIATVTTAPSPTGTNRRGRLASSILFSAAAGLVPWTGARTRSPRQSNPSGHPECGRGLSGHDRDWGFGDPPVKPAPSRPPNGDSNRECRFWILAGEMQVVAWGYPLTDARAEKARTEQKHRNDAFVSN